MALVRLDPRALSAEAVAAVREILVEGESTNTRRSYQGAWRYLSAWHQLRFGAPMRLPVPATAVVQFIVDHTTRVSGRSLVHELPAHIDAALVAAGIKHRPGPLKLASVVQRVAALATFHALRRLPNPAEDPAVRQVLRHARRAHAKRGERPRQKTAAIGAALHAMLATCDDSLLGVRDRALLCFGWASGGRRRSEIAAARVDNLTRLADGSLSFRMTHSKTRQEGAQSSDAAKPLAGLAAAAIQAWLERAGLTSGPLFRRVRGSVAAEPLGAAAVRSIVKRRAMLAGLDGDFGAHSLRSGFVTEAGRQDLPLPDVMALTGHQSVQSVLGYWRSGQTQTRRATELLDRSVGARAGPDVDDPEEGSQPAGPLNRP